MDKQAKAMIQKGKIGKIRQAHVEYFQEWATFISDKNKKNIPWRLNKKISGYSFTTADIGTHAYQLLTYLTGKKVKSLLSNFYVTGQPKKMEDTAFMHLELEDRIPATLMKSQSMIDKTGGVSIRIEGNKCSIDRPRETPDTLHCYNINKAEQIPTGGTRSRIDNR